MSDIFHACMVHHGKSLCICKRLVTKPLTCTENVGLNAFQLSSITLQLALFKKLSRRTLDLYDAKTAIEQQPQSTVFQLL